ncbi:uncharacterized protein BBA_10295 [Beauveria bassiana ARSEF 2860]|uniref:Uncharacterized protein n=1 Tax=Beauveria bassiana (strain ARSEF 2860) TaxID=655819 RepID=J4UER5_BEAB2|nr:uncharacterized protein BBA_10295 [Beauveria bassiana ARSEF 2860]EJP60757.1 hypothetical protein BBA_10295 [Beauveria bassiana ARSEF 2860]
MSGKGSKLAPETAFVWLSSKSGISISDEKLECDILSLVELTFDARVDFASGLYGSLKIYKGILKKCPALLAKYEWAINDSIRVDETSSAAGHILVHYLLTDQYNDQTTSSELSKAEKLGAALTTALQVYCERPLMKRKEKCEFPGIGFIDDWIATYLATRIRSEFQALTHESATLLLNEIGRSKSLNGIVIKCMLQLWREKMHLLNDGSAEDSPSTISNVDVCETSADRSECFTLESTEFSDGSDAVSL